jgi:hypothetical protein
MNGSLAVKVLKATEGICALFVPPVEQGDHDHARSVSDMTNSIAYG